MDKNVSLPRKAIVITVSLFVLVLSITFGRIYIHRNEMRQKFLIKIYDNLHEIAYPIEWLLEEPDLSAETIESHCRVLLVAITQFQTNMEAGYTFVSKEIPLPASTYGFDGVAAALRGNLRNEFQSFPADPASGLSQNERLFLQELLAAVEKLRAVEKFREPYQSYADRKKNLLKSFRPFIEEYRSFEEVWIVDGFRTYSGVSPFDYLKVR